MSTHLGDGYSKTRLPSTKELKYHSLCWHLELADFTEIARQIAACERAIEKLEDDGDPRHWVPRCQKLGEEFYVARIVLERMRLDGHPKVLEVYNEWLAMVTAKRRLLRGFVNQGREVLK